MKKKRPGREGRARFAPGTIQGFKPEGRARWWGLAREAVAWLGLFVASVLVSWLFWQIAQVLA